MIDFAVAEVIMRLSLHQDWTFKPLDSQNGFSNDHFDRLMYAKLPEQSFSNNWRTGKVLKLKRSYYGSKDAAGVLKHLLSQKKLAIGVWSIRRVSLHFHKELTIFMYWMDDLFVFAKYTDHIESCENQLGEQFKMKEFSSPK